MARELTKIHEEFLRGKISELEKILDEPKGEFVIVVAGYGGEKILETSAENFLEVYKNLLDEGIDKKSALREVAKKFNISRREVYGKVIESEKIF